MSAGEHITPPFSTQYMALFSYLEKEQIDSEKAEDILIRVYLDINNDESFAEVFKIVIGMTGFDSKRRVEELGEYLKILYNNTHHWILKGNTPNKVSSRETKTAADGDDSVSEISRKNNIVNLSEFRKIKRDDRQPKNSSKEVGRNDPCPCGSGKKYKKCCMREDQREKLLRSKLNEPKELNDAFLKKEKYIEEFGYPVLKYDFFILELINIAGDVLNIYNKYGNINRVKLSSLLKKAVKKARELRSKCQKCNNKCLDKPYSATSLDSFRDIGINIDSFPEEFQQETAVNYFYLELLQTLLDVFYMAIIGRENSEEKAHAICLEIGNHLIDFITMNCHQQCRNNCIMNYKDNAYCMFCSFTNNPLPCPKEGEISYKEIRTSKKDMLH